MSFSRIEKGPCHRLLDEWVEISREPTADYKNFDTVAKLVQARLFGEAKIVADTIQTNFIREKALRLIPQHSQRTGHNVSGIDERKKALDGLMLAIKENNFQLALLSLEKLRYPREEVLKVVSEFLKGEKHEDIYRLFTKKMSQSLWDEIYEIIFLYWLEHKKPQMAEECLIRISNRFVFDRALEALMMHHLSNHDKDSALEIIHKYCRNEKLREFQSFMKSIS